jgi:hypothetical protein
MFGALIALLALQGLASSCYLRDEAYPAAPSTSSASVVTVTVKPNAATLAIGQSLTLQATVLGTSNAAVTWSVEQVSGGAITDLGVYTAPGTPGTYTVAARSVADPAQLDRATITVTAPPPPPPATGPQYYVATNGNDAWPGSAAQPWRTIQKAMTAATPGSTVNIEAGTYPERLNLLVSGTPGNYIIFQPYGFSNSPECGGYTGVACGGDPVVLDYTSFGTVTDGVPYLTINGQSYVRIQGLVFQNYQVLGGMQRGVRIYGAANYLEFKYNKVLNIQNNGAWNGTNALLNFWVEGPANNVWIYGNEFAGIVSNYGETFTDVASSVVIENNWIHDVDAIAIAIAQNSSNTIVRGNLLEWSGKRRDGSIWYNSAAAPIYVNGGAFATIERNIIRDSAYGYTVVTEPGYPYSHDVVIRNNLAYRNANAGVMLGNWYSSTDGSSVYNIKVLNNTVYNCQIGFLVRPYVSASVVWENNIVANNSSAVVNTLGWPVGTMDYNLYYGGGTGPDPHQVAADPMFNNAAAADFTLRSGSPAIDAGDPATSATDVGTLDFAALARTVNLRIDIGAFEKQ